MFKSVRYAFVLPLVVLGAFSPRASATFYSYAKVSDTGTDGGTDISRESKFTVESYCENGRGGKAYASLELDFRAGLIRGRTHACVGPRYPAGADIASAEAVGGVLDAEVMTVTSDTLPLGTPVTFILCANMSSAIEGIVVDTPLIGTSYSLNGMSWGASLSTSMNGQHDTDNLWANPSGGEASSVFAGMNEYTVHGSTFRTIHRNVGQSFSVGVGGHSNTAVGVASSPGRYPVGDGTAGFAMTFGLMSITEGAHLSWAGSEWTGSCDDSSGLIPPNPVEYDTPAPATAVLLLAPLAMRSRRRRA